MSPFNDKTTATGREEPVCVCVCVYVCVCVCVCRCVWSGCVQWQCTAAQRTRGQEWMTTAFLRLCASTCGAGPAEGRERVRLGGGLKCNTNIPPSYSHFHPVGYFCFHSFIECCWCEMHQKCPLILVSAMLRNSSSKRRKRILEYLNRLPLCRHTETHTQTHTHTHTQKSVTLALTGSEGELGGLD